MFANRTAETSNAMCCRMLFSRAGWMTGAFGGMSVRLKGNPRR